MLNAFPPKGTVLPVVDGENTKKYDAELLPAGIDVDK